MDAMANIINTFSPKSMIIIGHEKYPILSLCMGKVSVHHYYKPREMMIYAEIPYISSISINFRFILNLKIIFLFHFVRKKFCFDISQNSSLIKHQSCVCYKWMTRKS